MRNPLRAASVRPRVPLAQKLSRTAASLRYAFSKEQVKRLFTARSFKSGGYTAFACVVVVAIAAAVVTAVEALPSSYTSIDISEGQPTTISDETRSYLDALDEDVAIYLIAEEGQESEYLDILLDNYAAASEHITVEQKDPVLYPTFASQYTSETLPDNSLILVCGDESRVVTYSDLYTLNSSTYSYDFAGESAITGAIVALTSDDLPKVYYLTGHGEQDLPSDIQSDIESANYETAELNLLSEGSIPGDADAVVMYAPESDLGEEEKDALLDYLEGGGSFLLVTDYDDADMPNLDDLMNAYGLEAVDGLVVEGDGGYRLMGYPYYLLPSLNTGHEITAELGEEGAYVMVPFAHGIQEIDQYRSSLSITPLLATSDSAYIKTDPANAETLEYEDGDISGQAIVGMAVCEEVDADDESAGDGADADGETAETRVVWYSSSWFLDPSVDMRVGGNNGELFTGTLAWLADADETTMSLASRSMGISVLTVDSTESSTVSTLMIGVVPVAFLIWGFVIWRARRRY